MSTSWLLIWTAIRCRSNHYVVQPNVNDIYIAGINFEEEMEQPELQEIMKSQGTRLEDLPPWMTYAASFEEKLDPKLEDAIKRYSEHVHDDSSNQNKEELHRQKEINNDIAKQYQFLTPEEYEDVEARIGKIMTHSALINTLRDKCGLKCWYRDHPQPGKITLLVQKHEGMQAPEVGCWVQAGYMPEYSIVRFDEHGVPVDERYRGWRTVLLQLIIRGDIKEEQADKYFGRATGPASERYRSTLYGFRNEYRPN